VRKNREYDHFDRILCQKIYKYFYDSLFYTAQTINTNYNKLNANNLFKLECFVEDLVLNTETHFLLRPDSNEKNDYVFTGIAETYFQLIPSFIEIVNLLSPMYEYSERINVFIVSCDAMGLLNKHLNWNNIFHDPKKIDDRFGGVTAAEIFNGLVKKIRNEWKEKGLQAKVSKKIIDSNKRYEHYRKYIESLFSDDNDLIVFRVNLYYAKQFSYGINVLDIRNNFDTLLKNKRHKSSVFGLMKGYIAKLEYNVDKKLYWHVIFFFDGDNGKYFNRTDLAEGIGKYWINIITKGRGDYEYIDDHYDSGSRIDKHDNARRDPKKFVVGCLQYLCKMDQFIKPKFETKVKHFRKGNPLKISIKRRPGRPRK